MKRILLISLLVLSFNGWTDDSLPPDGSFVSYHPNGQIQLTGKVADRKKSGVWEYYYDNGQLQQKEKYRNGRPIGAWQSFDSKGKLIGQHWYGNGLKASDIKNKEHTRNYGTAKPIPNKQ